MSWFCYLWTNSNNLKTYHQISSIGSILRRFGCLFWKFLNFVKNWFLKPVRRTGFLRSKCKSVIILLFMNQFQQFKNLSSNLIKWKLSVLILLLFSNFLNFVKNEFYNLCVAQAFWGQNVKVSSFCYLWTNFNNLKTYHQISLIGSFLCGF